MQMLMDAGAILSHKDRGGLNVLDWATVCERDATVTSFLLAQGLHASPRRNPLVSLLAARDITVSEAQANGWPLGSGLLAFEIRGFSWRVRTNAECAGRNGQIDIDILTGRVSNRDYNPF
jgi:hypothetical protein